MTRSLAIAVGIGGDVPQSGVALPAGYAVWFDADHGVFSDNDGLVPAVGGDRVAVWVPRGGSVIDADPTRKFYSSGASIVQLSAGVMNGRNGLAQYGGGGAALRTNWGLCNDQDWEGYGGCINKAGTTFFYVYRHTAEDGLNIPLWSESQSPSLAVDTYTGGNGFGMRAYVYTVNGTGSPGSHGSVAGAVSSFPVLNVYCSQYDGAHWDAYRNDMTDAGRIQRSSLTGDLLGGIGGINAMNIGTYLGAGTQIGALVIYPSSLSEADRVAVGAYLSDYYTV